MRLRVWQSGNGGGAVRITCVFSRVAKCNSVGVVVRGGVKRMSSERVCVAETWKTHSGVCVLWKTRSVWQVGCAGCVWCGVCGVGFPRNPHPPTVFCPMRQPCRFFLPFVRVFVQIAIRLHRFALAWFSVCRVGG